MNDVMRIMKKYNCTIHKNETKLFCRIEAGIAKFSLAEILAALENIHDVDIQKKEYTSI
jgi:hypothetical protein